jgi:[ribosomal protein S5]-alanine N-acetyltransferase
MKQPTLETSHLLLRPFRLDDATMVQRLAGVPEVVHNTLTIPYPYPDGVAEAWIGTHAEAFANGTGVTFAIGSRDGLELFGAISLAVRKQHNHAELGYWLGVPFWGRGHATEAAKAVVEYGFSSLGLHRIYAHHFTRNAASGRVLQKLGMTFEGIHREHVRKGDTFEDLANYGILKREWETRESAHQS